MIYLFDDNEFDQMSKNYNNDILQILEIYSNTIEHFNKFPNIEKIDDIILHASMVFIHYSFSPADVNNRICYLAEKKNIPLVIFSGQETPTLWDKRNNKIIRMIKKDRFYYNLISFLEKYTREPQKTTLKNLVYGENYEIERGKIIQNYLHKVLISTNENIYDQIFKSGSKQYKDLYELFYLAYGDNKYEHKFDSFEDEALNKPYNIQDISNKIKELTNLIKNAYE